MSRWMRRLDASAACAAITCIVYALFILLRWHWMGHDPSAFVVAGDRFVNPALAPHNLRVAAHSWGFDGQYYYALSLDPWPARRIIHGIYLDNPPYRQQRIVYPVLVWLFSGGGQVALVPWVMILVNLAALTLLGWVGGLYARAWGRHALFGLLLPFYPGFALSLGMDLPEAVSVLCVCAGVYVLRRGHSWPAALLLSLALLTRETAVLVVVAIGLVWLAQPLRAAKAYTRIAWPAVVVPLVVFGAWQYALLLRWHRIPVQTGDGNVGLPGVGLVHLLGFLLPPGTQDQRTIAVELCFLVVFFVAGALALRRAPAPPEIQVGWLLYLGLALVLSSAVWVTTVGFVRVLAEGYALGTMLLLSARGRRLVGFAAMTGVVWLYLALVTVAM